VVTEEIERCTSGLDALAVEMSRRERGCERSRKLL
jgi:hypothetical protein